MDKSNAIAELTKSLYKLAYNLWWTWTPRAQELFRALSPQIWEESNHNAVLVMSALSDAELSARLGNVPFREQVSNLLVEFETYLADGSAWGRTHAVEFKDNPICYFSPEFAFHESLPIYSGGLGVLAGDHMKSASDLGLNLTGVGLFYREGYFKQTLRVDGMQQENYELLQTDQLPISRVTDKSGKPVETFVQVGHSMVKLYAWELCVGRIKVYLLDSRHPDNEEHLQELTARVYGGDINTRIGQEIVLGVGGVRLLRQLGITRPAVYHMNEGHSAFLTLELIYEQMLLGKSLDEATNWVRQHCVFTTHTPVPAGHDRFKRELISYALDPYATKIGLSIDQIMQIGRVNPEDEEESFCMTVLALKMSRKTNAVSELHQHTSREMWKDLYKVEDTNQVPIGHITNGVHVLGWMQGRSRAAWDRFLGPDWVHKFTHMDFWNGILDSSVISDEEIWALKYELKRDLVEFVRQHLREQYRREGGNGLRAFSSILSPDALTIGFARRFATYKRAPMIFSDLARTIELFNNPDRPVQIIYSGKAHPRDDQGKRFIKKIAELSRHPQLFGKVVFLENYDMGIARQMISGCDIWLNNPRRPQEASGTSGQKIAINGGLHLSIMDGWWREAFDGTNGFAIGNDDHAPDVEEQDKIDTEALYNVLEQKVIPTYFNRDDNDLPRDWINHIRRAIHTLIPIYNTDRMLVEYTDQLYRQEVQTTAST